MPTRKYTSLPYIELPVADGNFDSNRVTIDMLVLHTMAGTWQGAAARFNNPTQKVSAHYGVKYDGGLIAWLEEYNVAYANGNYLINQKAISIEHEDMGNYNSPRPDILYTASAKLVYDICKFYNIPIDRKHIVKHSEIIATGCPDALDVDRIVKEAKALSTPPTEPMATITQKDLDKLRLDRDTNYNNYIAARNTITTLTDTVNQQASRIAELQKQVSGNALHEDVLKQIQNQIKRLT